MKKSRCSFLLRIYEISPVSHLNNVLYRNKFNKMINYLHNNIYLFPFEIQKYYKDIIDSDYKDIKNKYLIGLKICSDYFTHNPKIFKDPYYDILTSINCYYNYLSTPFKNRIHNKLYMLKIRIKFLLNIN